MKKDKRFKTVYNEGGVFSDKEIFVDTQTGVNYLWVSAGYSSSVVPLLDKDGKPLVSSTSELED